MLQTTLPNLLSHAGMVGFVLVIAATFCFIMAIRPDARGPIKKTTVLACAVVGIAIGLLFLSTYSLYTQTTTS
ncbi:MAG: hypothetical protein K6T63_08300 [Alicyclobacillus herbarius]|uniref:hypothetical protein n=1 Tax=Alicyclobacillus herbarius TaxID=122960 RepID=UPI000404D7B9|nr:hypothetical protein [Alicyclobacillus herbarius]MCL6632624.1 hypothetical protein [Alicyclobacillus herbarius]